MSSVTHTQTIDCWHHNKFFSNVFNQSNVFAKYMDNNLSVLIYIYIYILIYLIEIIHRLEGNRVFFSFSQNKMALFLFLVLSLEKKMTLIQHTYICIYIRNKTNIHTKTMIYTYDNKKGTDERDYKRKEESKYWMIITS
jgi:hypothetical protein